MSDLDPTARRLAQVRTSLTDLDLSALLVSHPANIRYLTGFSGSSGVLLLGLDRNVFLTDGRYEEQAESELSGSGIEIGVVRDGVMVGLGKRVEELWGGARVGFEGARLSYGAWRRLKQDAESIDWRPVSGLVEEYRALKDDEEIAAIEEAVRVARTALLETLPLVTAGARECDLALELDYRMRRLGASGPAFETIVASGPNTALPHAATGNRPLREGELLLIDFGARCQGYSSDMTRTFVLGAATARQAEVYELVLRAQVAAIEALGHGVAAADVDEAARRVFREAGLEGHFPHSTGHGLGLEVHEDPRLSRRSEERLKGRMVVTVEPGLYFAGWGGIRIEDDLVVRDGKARPLVDLDQDELRTLAL